MGMDLTVWMHPRNFPVELQGIEIHCSEQTGEVGPVDWKKHGPLFSRFDDCRVRTERIGNMSTKAHLRELLAERGVCPLLFGLVNDELGSAVSKEQFAPMKVEIDQVRMQHSALEPELRIFLCQMELLIHDAELEENPIEIG